MRTQLALSFLALSTALSYAGTGCNETDPEALYIDVLYQVRCIDCEPASNDRPARDIHFLDGDEGYRLSCNTSPADDGTLVSFKIQYTDPDDENDNLVLEVDQAGLGDTSHGAGCLLKVGDGGSTYEGRCADGATSTDAPCAIDLEREGDIITGTLSCDKVPIQDMTTPFRYLKAPGGNRPAKIEIRGCTF